MLSLLAIVSKAQFEKEAPRGASPGDVFRTVAVEAEPAARGEALFDTARDVLTTFKGRRVTFWRAVW